MHFSFNNNNTIYTIYKQRGNYLKLYHDSAVYKIIVHNFYGTFSLAFHYLVAYFVNILLFFFLTLTVFFSSTMCDMKLYIYYIRISHWFLPCNAFTCFPASGLSAAETHQILRSDSRRIYYIIHVKKAHAC